MCTSIATMSLSDLETPCTLIDYDRLVENIRAMQDRADRQNVRLRPHIKTHKCLEIARLQLDQGAVGITTATISESIQFIANGVHSITLAHPIVTMPKLDRLLPVAREYECQLNLIVDSMTGIDMIAAGSKKYDIVVNVLIKIDVGLHRCGVQPTREVIIPLVKRILAQPLLAFSGIISHAGHVYAADSRETASLIARDEVMLMNQARDVITAEGFPVYCTSIGATPTILAHDNYEGVTEIRPGNYVFFDQTPLRLKLIEEEEIALSVLTTVISKNNRYLIVDAGSKMLSSDTGAYGAENPYGYGRVYSMGNRQPSENRLFIEKMSEEHGFIADTDGHFQIGDFVRVFPNHACAVGNLTNRYVVVSGDNIMCTWPTIGRNRTSY